MKIACLLITFIFLNVLPAHAQHSSEPVKDSVYTNVSAKLKKLYYKQLESKSYIQYSILTKAFAKKLYKKGVKRGANDNGLDWIEKNLDKTSFTSFYEAERDWIKILNAQDTDRMANHVYHDYMIWAMMKHGPQIYLDVLDEVRQEHPEKLGYTKLSEN